MASKALKERAKKYGVKLTYLRAGKRVAKPDWRIEEQVKIASKKAPKTKKKVYKTAIKKLSASEAKSVARSLGQRGGLKTARKRK